MSASASASTSVLASYTVSASGPHPSADSISSPAGADYASLSKAIGETQRRLNAALTEWKDALGDSEKSKEDVGKVAYGQGRASRMAASDPAAVVGEGEDSASDGGGDDEGGDSDVRNT